jgi:SAM-dependent methyltransferase
MDELTMRAYAAQAGEFASDWEQQPIDTDLHGIVASYFGNGTVADLGCGSGRDAAWLAASGREVVGFDASPELLSIARSLHPGVEFRLGTLPDLEGVEEGSFDSVLCETVLMHLGGDEVAPAIGRILELLTPGGTLYLSWRVAETTSRDEHGRLYLALPADEVRAALGGCEILLDEEVTSRSSSRRIHRIVARRRADRGSAGSDGDAGSSPVDHLARPGARALGSNEVAGPVGGVGLAPPEDPDEWSNEEWIAWLEQEDLADHGAPGPASTAGRVVHSTGGQLLGQSMLGLAKAIYGRQSEQPAIVEQANSDPEDEPISLMLDPDFPDRSTAKLRDARRGHRPATGEG